MSEITKGDLVMVIRGNGCPTCPPKTLGRIFMVEEITGPHPNTRCPRCLNLVTRNVACYAATVPGTLDGYELSRLKRIPPLAELESTETKEVLHA